MNKKIFILLALFILAISVSTVCANDVNDTNIQNDDFNIDDSLLNQDNSNVLGYNQNNHHILSDNGTNKSNITKINTEIQLSSNASGLIKSNSKVVFNVSLTDENGTPMNNSIVKLVNKHFEKPVIIGTIKVINGTGNFSYVPEKSTMLDVYAFYEGNDNYTNSSSNDFIMGFTFGKLSFMDIYILTYYDQKSINLEYDIKYDYSKDSPLERGISFSNSMVINGNGFEINGLDKTCLGAVKSESTLLLKNIVLNRFSGDLGPDSGQIVHLVNGKLNIENAIIKNTRNTYATPLFFSSRGPINIINCTFLNNNLAATYLLSEVWNVQKSVFINNTAASSIVGSEMGINSFSYNTFFNDGNTILKVSNYCDSIIGNYFGTNDDAKMKSYYSIDNYLIGQISQWKDSKLDISGPDTFSEDDLPNYKLYLTNRVDGAYAFDAVVEYDENYGKVNPNMITLSNKQVNVAFTPVTYGNTALVVSSKYGILATKDIEITKSKLNNYDMALVSDDVLYGGNLGINIALKDIDGNLVSEKVHVDINGSSYTLNIVNGTGFMSIPDLLPGNYKIIAKVISTNPGYRNTTIIGEAKVNLGKLNINLTTSNNTINDEYPINLTAAVTNSYSNFVANALICINDNDKNILNITTNDKGVAIGTIYPNAGSHSYTAYYYASKLFENAQSNQINVYVNDKIHTKLTLTSNTTNNVNLNDKIKFTVKLVDGNNSPIANESVILYNDESIWTNLITDENGSADFVYSQSDFGILKIKAVLPVSMKYYSAYSDILKIAVSKDNSFLTLAFMIDALDEGDTLNLAKDYIFNNFSDADYINGILINNRHFTINGNGHRIDGNNLARIFHILNSNITLSNLYISNAGSYFNNALEHGAVLNDYMGILTLNNCTFENNSLKGESYIWGGAIYNKGILNVSDSVFKNNSVISNKSYARSGAIFNNFGGIAGISNSVFENNYAIGSNSDGGALSSFGVVDIDNSIFINNYVNGSRECMGGALYIGQGSNATCIKSVFINNSALSSNKSLEYGGAISDDSEINCYYNIFINNNANRGSAVFVYFNKRIINDNYWGSNSDLDNVVSGSDIGDYITLKVIGDNVTYTTIPTEYIIKFDGKNSDKLPEFNTLIKLIPNLASLNCSIVNVSSNDFKVLLISNQVGNLTLIVGPEFNNLTTFDIEVKQLIKKNYTIDVIGNNFTCDDDVSFDIKLVDVNGKGINGVVNYTFNNETKSVELKDGMGSIELGKLDANEYTILIDYVSKDLFYNNLSVVKAFNVTKSEVVMDVNVSNIYYGENGTVVVKLPVLADGNVTFIIKDVLNKTSDVKLGYVSCILPILNVGDYEIITIYSGNDRYDAINTTTAFSVVKSNPQLTVNISNVNYGDEIIANVSLITGNIKLNGTVVLNIKDKTYEVNVVNGNGNITIGALPVGSYNVLANYSGNSNTNSVVNSTAFNVTKTGSFLNVSVDDIVVGNDEIIRISVPEDATGNITVIVDDVKYEGVISNGSVVITVPGLSKGEHNLSVIYSGDENYNSTSVNSTFIVKAGTSNLAINVKNIVYGDNLVVVGSVNSDAAGNIIFTVNGLSQDVKIVSGKAVATFKGLNAGNYNVLAKYSGDKYYVSTQTNATVKVNKAQSTIDLIIGDIIEGKAVNITAIVNKDATGNVTFEIPGLYTPRDKSIINGSSLWVIAPLTSGEYMFIAKYNGDNNYLSSNISKIISYNQTKTILDVDVEVKGSVIIKANLTAVDGQKITAWVYVTIKDNVYKVPVFNGTGYLDIGKLPGGIYNYSALFEGTNVFIKSIVNGTFEVPSINLEVPYLVKYYSSSDKLVAILTDGLGNPIVGKNVTFCINNVNYTRVTDNEGKASMGIGLIPGIYNVTASYENITVKSGITVKSTILANNITKIFRNGTQYYAKFLNSDGSPLINQKVTFNINGVFYYRFTGDDGVAKLTISLWPGEYILTAMHSNGQARANLVKVLPPLITSDLIKYYKNDSQFSVKVIKPDGSVAGAGEKVTFNINGVFYTRITGNDGVATLKISLRPGNYIITSMYNDYAVGNNVTVLPTLITKNLDMKYLDGSSFTAQTVDGQGNPLANQNVSFNVNGVFYHKVTDNNGIAKLGIRLMSGEYIITSIWNDYQVGNTIKIA